jgi:hypothetical protein
MRLLIIQKNYYLKCVMRIFFFVQRVTCKRGDLLAFFSLTHSALSHLCLILYRGKKSVFNQQFSFYGPRGSQSVFLQRREQRYWMDVLGKWYDFRAIKLCALFQWRWVGAHDSELCEDIHHSISYACNRISRLLLCVEGDGGRIVWQIIIMKR